MSDSINQIVSFIPNICWSRFFWGQRPPWKTKNFFFLFFSTFFREMCLFFLIKSIAHINRLVMTFRFWVFVPSKKIYSAKNRKNLIWKPKRFFFRLFRWKNDVLLKTFLFSSFQNLTQNLSFFLFFAEKMMFCSKPFFFPLFKISLKTFLFSSFSLKRWCFASLTNTSRYIQEERCYYTSILRTSC